MGMSTHAVAIVEPDDEYRKKHAALMACRAADVDPPVELELYFESDLDNPSLDTRAVDIDDEAITPWSNDHASGIEVDVSRLPNRTTRIRFMNSWILGVSLIVWGCLL